MSEHRAFILCLKVVVMKMDDYKNSDNFQRTEGCKMISPHHFHPTNGVSPSDSNSVFRQGYSSASIEIQSGVRFFHVGRTMNKEHI